MFAQRGNNKSGVLDLQTIFSKISAHQYSTPLQFRKDFEQMFESSISLLKDKNIMQDAKLLQQYFIKEYKNDFENN